MPKTLLLVRHGKAELGNFDQSDFDRKLTERGIENAHFMSEKWKNRFQISPILISSDAKRALKTAKIFAKTWNITQIQKKHSLYNAEFLDVLALICNLDNQHTEIVIFGHNPSLSDLSNYLCENENCQLPTCGMVEISLDIDDWQLTSKGTGKINTFDFPKR
ncbi:MAG: histidine phosphatase family protein [Sphingobacteriaceae bacterium]|nr:histidine phosphatase family protein [Sphingobacteriaceae bacterium]